MVLCVIRREPEGTPQFTEDDIIIKEGYPIQRDDGLDVAFYVMLPDTPGSSSYPYLSGQDLQQAVTNHKTFIQRSAKVEFNILSAEEQQDHDDDDDRKRERNIIYMVIGISFGVCVVLSLAIAIFRQVP